MLYEMEENIKIYEDVIKDLCLLYEHLGMEDNPIKIYENFRYMYLNDFLSCGSFSYDIPDDVINFESEEYLPMDVNGCMILANYGVCRHTSDFLSHIYDYFQYDNAVFLIHQPNLKIGVINNGRKFLTNRQRQKYIEQALDGFDFFSQEEMHDSKEYGTIEVKIDFLPSSEFGNHAVNIVKKNKEKKVHILDTRCHRVGGKKDSNTVMLSNLGLAIPHLVPDRINMFATTYYRTTNYNRGLDLFNLYDSDIESDELQSLIYREPEKSYIEAYKEFKENHQEQFNRVSANFKQLIKKNKGNR